MALEVEVEICFLLLDCAVKIFYATTTLNASHQVAIAFTEDLKCGCSKFQWAFNHLTWLVTLLSEAIFKIPQMDDSVLVCCGQKWVDARHIMDWHGQVHFC
jgi:hypothetical protein